MKSTDGNKHKMITARQQSIDCCRAVIIYLHKLLYFILYSTNYNCTSTTLTLLIWKFSQELLLHTEHWTVKAMRGNGSKLTFRNHASYIQDGHTATLQTPHFIYFFNKHRPTYWIFLKMLHTLSFSLFKIPFISRCYLFWFLYYLHFTYRMC
jgi:hypothetical protein